MQICTIGIPGLLVQICTIGTIRIKGVFFFIAKTILVKGIFGEAMHMHGYKNLVEWPPSRIKGCHYFIRDLCQLAKKAH